MARLRFPWRTTFKSSSGCLTTQRATYAKIVENNSECWSTPSLRSPIRFTFDRFRDCRYPWKTWRFKKYEDHNVLHTDFEFSHFQPSFEMHSGMDILSHRTSRIIPIFMIVGLMLAYIALDDYVERGRYRYRNNKFEDGVPFSKNELMILNEHSFDINPERMLIHRARKAVLVTVATQTTQNISLNMKCHTERTTGVRPVVFALDKKVLLYANVWSIPSIEWYDVGAKTETQPDTDVKIVMPNMQVIEMKYKAVYHVLRLGYDVLLSDVEAVWCMDMKRRFEGLIHTHRATDVFIQLAGDTDTVRPALFYVVSTERSIKLFKSIIDDIASLKTEKKWTSRVQRAVLVRNVLNMFHKHGCTDNDRTVSSKVLPGDGVNWKRDRLVVELDEFPKQNCSRKWDLHLAELTMLPWYERGVRADHRGLMSVEGENHTQIVPGQRGKVMRTTNMELCDAQAISVWHGNWKWPLTRTKEQLARQGGWIVNKEGNCQLDGFRW